MTKEKAIVTDFTNGEREDDLREYFKKHNAIVKDWWKEDGSLFFEIEIEYDEDEDCDYWELRSDIFGDSENDFYIETAEEFAFRS